MEISAGTDPFELFQTWFDEAVTAEINDPDAIALASVNADGMPSVRMVLLRQWSEDGFLFFTNYQSRKSGELLATGKAAFCMHWKSLRKQVRVTGQLGKATAAQSQPLGSRAELMAQVEAHDKKFPDAVTRPPHWGGFCLVPEEIEFWADGEHRLHDRFRFTRADSGWDIQRLNP